VGVGELSFASRRAARCAAAAARLWTDYVGEDVPGALPPALRRFHVECAVPGAIAALLAGAGGDFTAVRDCAVLLTSLLTLWSTAALRAGGARTTAGHPLLSLLGTTPHSAESAGPLSPPGGDDAGGVQSVLGETAALRGLAGMCVTRIGAREAPVDARLAVANVRRAPSFRAHSVRFGIIIPSTPLPPPPPKSPVYRRALRVAIPDG
jgi:hypothetical protein